MPIVHVNLIAGRSQEEIARIAAGVTAVLVAEAKVRPEQVRVLVHEIEPAHWFVAGAPRSPPEPPR
jgi:4-oxalocrotonate tautomerase